MAQEESGIQSRTLRVETLNSDTEQNEIANDEYTDAINKAEEDQKSLVQRFKMRQLFEMPENSKAEMDDVIMAKEVTNTVSKPVTPIQRRPKKIH